MAITGQVLTRQVLLNTFLFSFKLLDLDIGTADRGTSSNRRFGTSVAARLQTLNQNPNYYELGFNTFCSLTVAGPFSQTKCERNREDGGDLASSQQIQVNLQNWRSMVYRSHSVLSNKSQKGTSCRGREKNSLRNNSICDSRLNVA